MSTHCVSPVPLVDLPEKYSWGRILLYRLQQAADWVLQVRLQRPLTLFLVTAGITFRLLRIRRLGLDLIMRGRRLGRSPLADKWIPKILSEDPKAESDLISLLGPSVKEPVSNCAGRMLVLKAPRLINGEVVEKGAIIFKFTETFAPIYKQLDVTRLARHYTIVLEPSWVGYSLSEILVWLRLAPEKVVVMAPYKPDYELLESLGSNLVPISIGPADWVNPSFFHAIPGIEKKYDAIYVANYNPKKRVDRFLRAVVRVSQRYPDFRAAVLCVRFGKSARTEALQDVMIWAKSKANLDVLAGVKQPQLNELFNQAKVNVLLSLREGMNKGLAEGLLAGTPALLISESACGNHRHINKATGRLVQDKQLEKALVWFVQHHESLTPSEWAVNNISPSASTARLSETLRKIECAAGRQWTVDLAIKANQPEMQYLERGLEDLHLLREQILATYRVNGT